VAGTQQPPPPAAIVDVGGVAGRDSLSLAGQGHDVHLVDASARQTVTS